MIESLVFSDDYAAAGHPVRELRLPARWTKVRRGAYYPAAEWEQLDAGARHRVLVHASARFWAESVGVISHVSAAAIWGLPIIGSWPTRVHTTMEIKPRSSQGGLQVHETFDPPCGVEHDGLLVTDPVRTVIDLARFTPLRSALATADHALNKGLVLREQLETSARALPSGARGRNRARLVVDLADGLSESVLESLSRAVMYLNGFPRPTLQVPLEDDDGTFGRGDFGWPGLIGECDGKMKYGADLSDGDPAAAVFAEKQREDRIRRFSELARWGWSDAYEEYGLCVRLREKGLRTDAHLSWVA